MGPGPRARGWTTAFGGDEEARRFAPRMAVRLLHTRRPTPKEDDSWAWALVPEAGPQLSVETKRHGDSLLVRKFAFSALGDQRTSCMTCGARPLRHRLGASVCIGGDFSWRFRARAGESTFKKGFIPRVAAMPSLLSHSLCPFASNVSALRRRSSPWPCKFTPSTFRLSGRLTWRTAC
jgi:hypothetical protein